MAKENIYEEYLLNYSSYKMSKCTTEAEVVRLLVGLVNKSFKAPCYAYVYHYSSDSYTLESLSETEAKEVCALSKKTIPKTNPLIRYFTDRKIFTVAPESFEKSSIKRLVSVKGGKKYFGDFFRAFQKELSVFNSELIVPAFFEDKLLMILLLGKKMSGKKYTLEDKHVLRIIAEDSLVFVRNVKLHKEIARQHEVKKDLFFSVISALTETISAKDQYTKGHLERVKYYCHAIAKYLPQNMKVNAEELEISALLHDVGKVAVPENILNKPSKLTKAELDTVRCHPVIGAEILSKIDNIDSIVDGIKYHHERYDGKGYPSGIKISNVPMIASIISLADAYDAMTSDRPYRKALTPDQARKEILENSGKQFHPVVVKAFIEFYRKYIFRGKN